MDPEHGAVKASSGSKEKKQKQKQKQKQQTHSKRQEATGCEFEARGFLKTSKWKLKELSICMTPLPQISL